MNGPILSRIEHIEQDLKEVKALLKNETSAHSSTKVSKKVYAMKGLWKKLKITDAELEEAKKAVFDFDVEKYVKVNKSK